MTAAARAARTGTETHRRTGVVVVTCLLFAGLTACADTDGSADVPPDAGGAGIDTDDTASDASAPTRSRCVVVTTTEFRADGGVTVIDADTLEARVDVTAVHSDAIVRTAGDRVFVINRQGGDSVQELDPRRGFGTVYQRSVGRGANPWGLAMLDDGTAWVPLYNEGTLLRVDTNSTGESGFRLGPPVALPAWTDADGRVEPLDAFALDGALFVVAQGLGDYPNCTPDSRGWVHAFDPDSLAASAVWGDRASLELAACNPTTYALVESAAGPLLALGYSGNVRAMGSRDDDGGIELVDLQSGETSGLIATESDFGDRDLVALAIHGRTAWVALASADFAADVRAFDLDTGTLSDPVWSSGTAGIFGLGVAYDKLWVVDRTRGSAGVVVLDPNTGQHLAGPIQTGFPPFDLAFVEVEGSCVR